MKYRITSNGSQFRIEARQWFCWRPLVQRIQEPGNPVCYPIDAPMVFNRMTDAIRHLQVLERDEWGEVKWRADDDQ